MKQQRERIEELDEPVGIVIRSGGRAEVTPRFAAFVWGPAPETLDLEPGLDAKAA
jgi:hypothetical protein